MIDLDKDINKLSLLLGSVRHYTALNEATTKSAIIVPILQELQWNVRSPFEVVREYSLDSGTVDYALKIYDEIRVLIEVKKISENLDKYENQIKKYAIDKNINLFILTDGIRWQFYTWLKEGIEIFKFCDLDIKSLDPQYSAKELVSILSKQNILSNKSYDYIRFVIKKDVYKFALFEEIIEIWHAILDEPHPLLCNLIIELVKEAFGRSPEVQDIKKVLTSYNNEFNRIRGIVKIGRPDKITNLEEIVINCIKRLHKHKNVKWVMRSDIAMRVHRHMNTKILSNVLHTLKEKGLIQLNEKGNIKIINQEEN